MKKIYSSSLLFLSLSAKKLFNMLKLNKITFTGGGKKINYDYTVSSKIKKFFNINDPFYSKYEIDVSNTPNSIAIIPLLANIMPISWFVGFDVYIDELDKTFYESIKELRIQFEKHHPEIKLKGNLKFDKLVDNIFNGNNSILLFSGGLDSFESLTRNYSKDLYLASIHGADIEIKDIKRWNQFKEFNNQEKIINKEKLLYIESNLRDFYNYKVDLLVDIGWWGKIQHGMALIGVLAPMTYSLGITQVFIASSNTGEVNFGWGSCPEIDENMKWANLKIAHDGYHLRRTEKIVNVINFVKEHNENINLRVCYSELRNGANCNVCAKCQRTILGIILAKGNPANYGFDVQDNFYQLLFLNFGKDSIMTKGLEYEWWCLQEKVKENKPFFVIKNKEVERMHLEKFINLDLKTIINKNSESVAKISKIKYILRNKFSGIYSIYLKLRY